MVATRASLSLTLLNFAGTQKNAEHPSPDSRHSPPRGLCVSDTRVMKNSSQINFSDIDRVWRVRDVLRVASVLLAF